MSALEELLDRFADWVSLKVEPLPDIVQSGVFALVTTLGFFIASGLLGVGLLLIVAAIVYLPGTTIFLAVFLALWYNIHVGNL